MITFNFEMLLLANLDPIVSDRNDKIERVTKTSTSYETVRMEQTNFRRSTALKVAAHLPPPTIVLERYSHHIS